MDKTKKIIVSALLIAIAGAFSGSGRITGPLISVLPEAIPLGSAFVPVPVASGVSVKKNDSAEIDYSNAKDGYVMVRGAKKEGGELRAIIKCPGGASYTYILSGGGYDVFPLSEGSGSYQVGVYESVRGAKFSTVASATFRVTLENEFAPFLRPNQYVNYTSGSEAVKKAVSITGNASGIVDKVAIIYHFVTASITYDKELAATVKSGYLTNVDAVLRSGKGICFDYAAVMAAMLRSQQIPAKLVIGYTGSAYHAWINVYSAEKGWIDKAIYFDGASWQLMDPTFAANKSMQSGKNISYKAKLTY